MYILYYVVLFVNVCWCSSQSSTMLVKVVEISSTEDYTFVCTVSSATTLTRWTNLPGYTGTSLMSFQNGVCRISPSDSFLSNRTRYSYTCNSTVYQVTLHPYHSGNVNNNILSCQDAVQYDSTISTWIIKIVQDAGTCSYCEPTITFDVMDVNEGDNVTFVCRVTSDVPYVTWNVNFGSHTAPMGVTNGKCTTQPPGTTFLDNTTEYIYTCNNTVYQVTKLNVQRSQHNDIYVCTSPPPLETEISNWIIKVKAPVKSVTMTPADNKVDVLENTVVEFTCTTSTSRPSASVYWYIRPNGNSNGKTQITENVTTMTDYNELSVIASTLRFVPGRQYNNMKIFCVANNSVNTSPVMSIKKLLNVLCYPRATGVINTNITSEKNNTITIVFNVIAYPPPTFTWWQLLNETWTDLNNDDNFDIQSSNLQSNLTIRKVGMEDFTWYKVIVENDVDKMEQLYSLSPYDKPDPPTGFKHIESQTTTTSIHLEWKPGFDNGPSQTFFIKYKVSSDTLWKYIDVPDNGEQIMEHTLTGLTENTRYDIVILASNEKGNSPESSVLITTTKAISGITITQSMGPLIGGVTGGTVGLVIVIALVVFVGRRNSYINDCFGKLKKSDGINNSADEHAYYNAGRLDATAANQGSDDTKFNRPKSDANGISHTTEEAAYYNVESVPVPTYEMINRNYMDSTPYSTLEQTEQGTTSDVTGGDKKEIYENLKTHVF